MVCLGFSLLWAVEALIYVHHHDTDRLRTRRRIQYEDMSDYVGGARRVPGPSQISHNVY
jgi:hypothetical protein